MASDRRRSVAAMQGASADAEPGGQRSERRKWLACFDNIDVLCVGESRSRPSVDNLCSIFMVAISEFDQLLYEDETVNRLTESVTLFESVVNSPYFQKSAVYDVNPSLALSDTSQHPHAQQD